MANLMEKSFDLGSMLRKHQKKHKSRPTHFESVAGGVQRRMENSYKQRKSSRLSSFDCIRNLPQPSPVPESVAKQKADCRRQQLQKWKEEKDKKKKELAARKVKPFITGVAHNSLRYMPPPPARAVPSSSGCVTRSQSARHQMQETKKVQPKSFAPNNAGFRAPLIKTLTKMPKLEPLTTKKDPVKLLFNFHPVLTTANVTTRSRAYQRIVAESRAKAGKAEEIKPKGRIVKPISKHQLKSIVVQSSSSSENESHMHSSASSSDINLTARIISSSEDSTIHSSTENDSLKSLQSSSSCELVLEIQSPIGKRKSLRAMSPTKTVTPHKSTQESQLNTPRNPVPKSESSSEERLRSPKSPVNVPMTPEQISEEFKKISPCVTMSRGKDNARREMKKKIEEGLLDEDASDMVNIEHFQRQLASEIKRMTKICEIWDKIYEQVSLPETIQGLVLGAVGQARLLMSQKMQQFSQLVQRCARPEPGSTLVTPADLRGFWDMVFIQVENVDMRFKELEELKERNWVEKTVAAPAVAARKPRAARPAASKPRAAAPSRLRDMIAAARKAKAQEAVPQLIEPRAEERTFEAGFFSVRSPARSPHTPATPRNKQSLLKAVLSSEAEKASASKKSASFAMLRASVLGKGIDCDGVEPLPPSPMPQINPHATPGRSILKQPQDNANKSAIKQIKVVLFNRSDNDMNTSTEDLSLSEEQVSKNKATKNIDLPKNKIDMNAKSELSPMDMERKEPAKSEKENRRKSKLIRQDAITTEMPPRMTRRMQKYKETQHTEQEIPEQTILHSDKKTPKRSSRKKVQPEVESTQTLQEKETQQTEVNTPGSKKRTPRRSLRNKVLTDVEEQQTPQTQQEIPQSEQKTSHSEKKTPKRSTRKSVLTEIESNAPNKFYVPMHSTRRRKTEVDEADD